MVDDSFYGRDSTRSDASFSSSFILDGIPSPCKRFVRSLYGSMTCRYIYIFLLIYNCGLGIWAVIDLIRNTKPLLVFYILECVINFLLFLDVLMRMFSKGCYSYWRAYTNIFEFTIVMACIIITALSIIGKEKF
jgi:hypothetical protein